MTKEEIKEMIDATISDNGGRGITGKLLNNALTEIINISNNSLFFYVDYNPGTLSESEISHNANMYKQVKNDLDIGNIPNIAFVIPKGDSLNNYTSNGGRLYYEIVGSMGILTQQNDALALSCWDNSYTIASDGSIYTY